MSNWKEIWGGRAVAVQATSLADLIRADGFDTGAGKVDTQAWRNYAAELARRLGIATGDSVFEVGCGSGALLKVFHEASHPVGGIDYSQTLIEHAQRAMPGMSFRTAEANQLAGAAQDFVIANSVFSYFPDLDYARGVLERMLTMARKGVALLDLPDIQCRAAAEDFRRSALAPGEYETRYRGLDHCYFAREWFAGLTATRGWRIEVSVQWLADYGNAPHRFNVILTRMVA